MNPVHRNHVLNDLLANNTQFKRVYSAHKKLDDRLREFDKEPFPTASRLMEKKKLKQEKLRHKEIIESMILSYTKAS